MLNRFSESELEAYLDEALPAATMASIEEGLRHDRQLVERLIAINGRRDAGVHSLGEVWRRHRISCPNRQQLGSFLLNALPPEQTEFIRWHIDVAGCRVCQANLDDLTQQQQAEQAVDSDQRRKKYFQSSAGLLKPQQ